MTRPTRRRARIPTRSGRASGGTSTTSTSRSVRVQRRNWEDARKYGFISGGGDRWYSQSLQALRPGHRVFVYLPRGATPASDGTRNGNAHQRLQGQARGRPRDSGAGRGSTRPTLVSGRTIRHWPILRARPVGQALPASQAYREPGFFANQNTAARFRHRATLEKLYAHFDVSAPESSDVPIAASQTRPEAQY